MPVTTQHLSTINYFLFLPFISLFVPEGLLIALATSIHNLYEQIERYPLNLTAHNPQTLLFPLHKKQTLTKKLP